LLVNAFVRKFNARMGKRVIGVANEALNFLLEYEYPGNVRELENIMEHAFVLCKDELIRPDCLPKEILEASKRAAEANIFAHEKTSLKEAEARIIKNTLKKNEGTASKPLMNYP
jgi:transcriptional regulator with PAS, ATPase and Fis domain